MKVLVTGGAGFIGSHLVERLEAARHKTVVLDNLSSGSRQHLPDGVRCHEADVRDRAGLESVLADERPEVVFHLAAQMNVRRSLVDPVGDAESNILGTLNVLDASAALGVRRVVFASSGGAIYGAQPSYPCRETDQPR